MYSHLFIFAFVPFAFGFKSKKSLPRVEDRHMDTKGGKLQWGGDGGVLNWAIGIDMYTLMCIKLMTNKNLQYKKKQTNKTTNTKLSLGYLYGNMLI